MITYDVFIVIYPDDEVQRSVSTVKHFVLSVFKKRALFIVNIKCPYLAFCARETLTDEFSFERDLLLDREAIIVFGDACLALLVDHQNKLDHCLFPCHPYLY